MMGLPVSYCMNKILKDGLIEFHWVGNGPSGYPIRELDEAFQRERVLKYFGPTPLVDYFAFTGLRICSLRFRELIEDLNVPDVKFFDIKLEYQLKRNTVRSSTPYYVLNAYSQIALMNYEKSEFTTVRRGGGWKINSINRMVLDEKVINARHFVQTGGGDPRMPTFVVVSDEFATQCVIRRFEGVAFDEATSYLS